MSKWVPGVALIGLICVMILPAPGVLGIGIGSCCIFAIALSAAMMLFDRFVAAVVTPSLATLRRWMRPKKRYVHAGSGMVRKR